METGTVKWFNPSKGYGFISREAGDDVFVHSNNILEAGYGAITDGDKVQFRVVRGEKGWSAESVTKIS
jgi:cold shock protein